MSKVNLIIGGRDYAVACAAGEEDHVRYLGGLIEDKLESLPPATAQSETRVLLFAALLLADEVSELREQVPPEGGQNGGQDMRLAERLDAIAQRLEALASAFDDLA
jgi:cell division protein ZapA